MFIHVNWLVGSGMLGLICTDIHPFAGIIVIIQRAGLWGDIALGLSLKYLQWTHL